MEIGMIGLGRMQITLIQMNDSHAYLDLHQEVFPGPQGPVFRKVGGYARIASLVKQIRAESPGRVMFLDCGDTFYGTHPVQASKGQAMVPVLNALGIEAMTPHWEFVYGPRRFRELAGQLNFPVLAMNIYEKESGKRMFPPYAIRELDGLKVGIIGAASNIVDKTMPPSYSEGLRFELGREELPGLIEELRQDKKVDLVVMISHLGFPLDMKMLTEVPGVDVCLSGHTHNRLDKPALAGNTIVIQSGCHGSFLGRLDLTISDGKIANCRHQLIEVAESTKPDPPMEAIIREQMVPYEKELSQVVGQTATDLYRFTCLESTMDNLLNAAMKEHTGAQVTFSNGWRYAAPVLAGPVTLNDLYNIVPIDPPVSTTELTGAEMAAMLEENLERTFSGDAYKQMGGYVKRYGGLVMHVKLENPAGSRIQKLFVGDQEVQPKAVYKVAFITEQGVPAKYGRNRQHTPDRIVDVMRKYLAKHKPVRVDLSGRLVVE